jgi:3-hydroxybutyryl-CoA dehydrogenase
LGGSTFLVEAVIEQRRSKATVLSDLGELARQAGATAVLATTTSSLSIAELAKASGHPEKFVGLHLFNPVPKMKLVELAFPPEATEETRERVHRRCKAIGKTPIEVPDIPGFIVNRLLFPYLFSAVELMSETGMNVGLDVSMAIGESLRVPVPRLLVKLVEAGSLGRKTGAGFCSYD